MNNRMGLYGGVALSLTGVAGLAAGGMLWNFQGKNLGLGSTITALVLLAISFVLLKPEPEPRSEMVPEGVDAVALRAPQASILGLVLAVIGTFGLAASGVLWNFQGLAFGLTGTITAIVALLLGFLFLWPLKTTRPVPSAPAPQMAAEPTSLEAPPAAPTTADAIALELAAEQSAAPPIELVTFAPQHLLPGQALRQRPRRAGRTLGRYRTMVNDLFGS